MAPAPRRSYYARDVATLSLRSPGAHGREIRRRLPVSLPTLYAPRLGGGRPGDEVELPDSERSHLRALRLAPGDRVELTDGAGRRWVAELRSTEGEAARCALMEPAAGPPDLPVLLAFGVAAKDRTLWLIEKAVELGVLALQPLEAGRSRSVADAGRSPGFWEKARRRSLAALKQCGGSRLPDIAPVRPLDEWLQGGLPTPTPAMRSARSDVASRGPSEAAAGEGPLRLLAAADGPHTLLEQGASWDPGRGAVLLVGPEGGLTPAEREACEAAGFLAVCLGPRTLRFETAAVAGLALLAQLWTGRRVS